MGFVVKFVVDLLLTRLKLPHRYAMISGDHRCWSNSIFANVSGFGVVVENKPHCALMTLRGRELQNGPKWAYYLDEARMRRSPLPTIILYIEYIVCSTTIISSGRRREYLPARGHTTDWDLTPTPWEECTSSQRVARHLPNPAIPPYYIKTPHCMEPRRWRIHIYALAGFLWKVP